MDSIGSASLQNDTFGQFNCMDPISPTRIIRLRQQVAKSHLGSSPLQGDNTGPSFWSAAIESITSWTLSCQRHSRVTGGRRSRLGGRDDSFGQFNCVDPISPTRIIRLRQQVAKSHLGSSPLQGDNTGPSFWSAAIESITSWTLSCQRHSRVTGGRRSRLGGRDDRTFGGRIEQV